MNRIVSSSWAMFKLTPCSVDYRVMKRFAHRAAQNYAENWQRILCMLFLLAATWLLGPVVGFVVGAGVWGVVEYRRKRLQD